MELGSGSSSNSSSSSSSDSLNGLKFGKKIYFQDVNGNVSVGSSSPVASGGKPPPVPAKKGKVGVGPGGGQPPRCQVEGCKVDLSDAKAYYSRHKVCAMHSKYGTVIVNGLQQRFCQQCSRFHLLPEFDAGKRSCRRRLAGHNERRRKPPPGSLLSSRFGSLSSPFLAESSGRGGSFLLDFSKYPALTGRDSWTGTKTPERSLGHQQATVAKFPPNMWHCNPENSPSEMLIQGSTDRSSYSDIPSGECFPGVSDCTRALSLLSNQPWGSRDRSSSLGMSNFVNTNGTPVFQSMGFHCDSIDGFSSPFWGFKGSECNGGLHEMPPDIGLAQISQSASNHYSGDLDVAQQTERDYLMLEHSGGYDSSVQNMHWSL